MKAIKKLAALFLAMLMILSCVGCGSTTSASKSKPTTGNKDKNALTVAVTDIISTLDPQNYARTSELDVINQIYDPLISTDLDGNIVYLLAESYTASEDGSSVDFVLRDGVKFHSGDVLKAEDVAYSLERGKNSAAISELTEYSSITVQDDTHFTWSFPDAADGESFDDLYTYIMDMPIVNKSYCEQIISDPLDDLKLNVDGTGAYMLKDINSNNDVTLEKFDDYFGTPANIQTVNVKYLTGSTETAFEAGNLDFAKVTGTNFDTLTAYDNAEGVKQVLNNFCVIISNCTKDAPTADLRVRQALAYCMNKSDLTKIASNDAGSPAYNLATPLVSNYADNCDHFDMDLTKANDLMKQAGYSAYNLATPLVSNYADNCDHFDMDLTKANDLMKQAGYSESNKLHLSLLCITIYPEWVSACEVLKEQLEQSYFDVSIEETSDTSRYFSTDFDIAIMAFTIGSIYQMYSAMFEDGAGLNLAGINDPALSEAFKNIKDADSAQAAMKLTTESLAYIPLYYNTNFYVYDTQLTPGQYNPERALLLYKDFAW